MDDDLQQAPDFVAAAAGIRENGDDVLPRADPFQGRHAPHRGDHLAP
jgi:hypothetical protein